MKERPILFSGHMPRAVREDRKTQTRRIVKQLAHDPDCARLLSLKDGVAEFGHSIPDDPVPVSYKSPFGVPGDRLWVREEHFRFGHWERKTKPSKKTGRYGYRFVEDSTEIRFPENAPESHWHTAPRDSQERTKPRWYKRLARFMPKWASRITLEVTGVRVERLNDISREDAKAEGVELLGENEWRNYLCTVPDCEDEWCPGQTAVQSFESLWESINGAESWEANPWVWVVEFQRVTP